MMEDLGEIFCCMDVGLDDSKLTKNHDLPIPLRMQSDYCDTANTTDANPQEESLLPSQLRPLSIPLSHQLPNLRLGKGVDSVMLKFGPTLASSAVAALPQAQSSPNSIITAGDSTLPFAKLADAVRSGQHQEPAEHVMPRSSPARAPVTIRRRAERDDAVIMDAGYLGYFGQW